MHPVCTQEDNIVRNLGDGDIRLVSRYSPFRDTITVSGSDILTSRKELTWAGPASPGQLVQSFRF